MPELPEVETIVRGLRRHLVGARVHKVIYASRKLHGMNPRGWRQRLAGSRFDNIERHGKFIALLLDGPDAVIVHLRMTGRLLITENEPRWPRDRLLTRLEDGRDLKFRDLRTFGTFEVWPRDNIEDHPGIARLGPDALIVSLARLTTILARSRRPIKAALLDQTRIAGLGNIYVDESLHAASIHPLTIASALASDEIAALRRHVRRILRTAIRYCGTTFDTFSDVTGRTGGFAPRLLAYGREDEPCSRCGTSIQRIKIVGRSSFFCPNCQRSSP